MEPQEIIRINSIYIYIKREKKSGEKKRRESGGVGGWRVRRRRFC